MSPEVEPGDYYDEDRAQWDRDGMQSDLKLAKSAIKQEHKLLYGDRPTGTTPQQEKAAAMEAAAAAAFKAAAGGSSEGGLKGGVTGGVAGGVAGATAAAAPQSFARAEAAG